MSPLLPLLLALLPSPALEGGSWLPTAGPAGDHPVQAIAAGGDGALYAAGQGFVYRMAPGQAWEAVGWYVPQLRWSEDDGFDATGPFPPAFLHAVEDELTAALETRVGVSADDEGVSEDLVVDLIEDYATEVDPRPESPYAVARMTTAPDGVWLGTGGGLFKASAGGVTGPIAELAPILDLAATEHEVVAATPQGLYRVVNGKAERWRQFTATSLARVDGRAAFVAEGQAWWDDGQVGPRALPTPTGQARLVASGGDILWVATDLAIYRREGEAYTLCPALTEAPRRLISTGDELLAVGDQVLYATDRQCSKWTRHEAPWLGGLRFNDAAGSLVGVWAATSEGVFLLGPHDPDLTAVTEVEGLKRRLAELPTLQTTYQAALVDRALDPAVAGYGNRPVWRMLLPDLRLTAVTHPLRSEDRPTFFGGTPTIETQPPRAQWQVLAVWKINFDFLTFGADSLNADGESEGTLDGDAELQANQRLLDTAADLTEDIVDVDQEVLVSIDGLDAETTDATTAEDLALAVLVAERRQMRRDRTRLFTDVRRLYQERLRLMFQMHTTRGDQTSAVSLLRVAELDAGLDVLTGGAWSKALGPTPSGAR